MTSTSRDPSPVGLIGVGLLGSALAARLLQAGFRVVGFDEQARARRELVALGGLAAPSARHVVDQCDRVLLSLPDSEVVASVIEQIRDRFSPGMIIIDTTTGKPATTQQLADDLARVGTSFLDATVAGSSDQVRRGEALLLVGGSAESYAACGDLFTALADRSFHLGPVGSGARMKLVVNLALGLHRAVLAEALALGESFGFSGDEVLRVLSASPAYSRVMESKGQKMIHREFSPQARLRQHLKDVRLMLAAGGELDVPLPLSRLHADILQCLVERGFGDEDNSAVLRAFVDRPPHDAAESGG